MEQLWGFLHTEAMSASMNMALDEALLQWNSNGLIPPTLRFYSWKNPSLSLGYFQDLSTIDLEAIKRNNCEIVRRMTGGSAVLHDDELTYSIVISENHPDIPPSIKEAYLKLSKGLLMGYKQLGIDVEYSDQLKRDQSSAVCFERPAFYELVFEGKKVSGNAQIRKKGTLLQHGSIPISMNVDLLFDLFNFPNEAIRQNKKVKFHQKATTIGEIKQEEVSLERVKAAFLEGFKEGLGINPIPFELSRTQWEEVKKLAKKYEDLNYKIVQKS
ncbi:lipoate--protein ligase family protein [Bacillus litorisediminis]|uniref:lipoate--protein ligase family protein n=1 Tax=Bacillus litorisediminis TaxID=2922713 RepID=UPI0036F267A8